MEQQTAKLDAPGPAIEVTLALAPWLQAMQAQEHALHLPVCQAAAGRLNRLLAELGIPGEVQLTLIQLEPADVQAAWGKVAIQGQLCTPLEDPAWWVAYCKGKPGLSNAAELQTWLEPYLAQPPEKAQALIDFLADACLETVRIQPELLMGPEQADRIFKELPAPARRKGVPAQPWPPPDADELLPVLRFVVALGISFSDRAAISQTMAELLLINETVEELCERLAAKLAPRSIGILLPAQRFQELTLDWQATGPAAFGRLRRRLAGELGFNLPPFQMEAVEGLGADEFAIRINGMSSTRLKLENLIEGLGVELHRQFPRWVTLPQVEAQLDLLDNELHEMVVETIALHRLTRLLRVLTIQGKTLRRLPVLLEHLLDYAFYQDGASGALALAGELPMAPPETDDEFAAQLAFLNYFI